MDNFNFNLFKYFYYVAYYEGFTNASKILSVAQPALSCSVKTLEKELGKELIVRTGKRFQLTEEGNKLYETLKSVFYILENDVNYFLKKNVYEELNIGIRHYLSDFILMDTLKKFNILYSNIKININLYSKLDTNKYEEEFDILIDYKEYTDLLVTNNKLALLELENIIVCGSEVYNDYREITSIKELDGAKIISSCPNKKKGKFQKWCYDNNVSFVDVISVNESKFCEALIKNNLGICLVNKKYIENQLFLGDIKEIKINEKIFNDNIELVFKNNKNIENINKFIKLLVENYNEEKR